MPKTLFRNEKILFFCLLIICGLHTISGSLPASAAPQEKERWDKKYQAKNYLFGKDPIAFLKQHVGILPRGKALDLAMGEGRNGVYLATQGFEVTGIDISEVGLKKAEALALERGVEIRTVIADLEDYQMTPNTYDVVVCTYFLQRKLFPQIISALKPGGVAVVETYSKDHLKYQPGFIKEYLLETNELLTLFGDLKVLRYQAVDTGHSAYASIIVQKP